MRRGFSFALALLAANVCANELTVDRRTIQINELVTISVELEGAFAGVDDLKVPVQNLEIVNQLGGSTTISITNGGFSRRKILRYLARPLAPGSALVGPLVIRDANGQRETLAPVSLQVLPDVAATLNDPAAILKELRATDRDAFFVVAEIDKQEAFVGEQVVVTWWLYNAIEMRQPQLGPLPSLSDFWSEDLDVRGAEPEQVMLGDMIAFKSPARRVMLYPLHTGNLTIPGLTVRAQVMRPVRVGPFGMLEGRVAEVSYTSVPLTMHVKPLPDGTRVDAVGELFLSCGKATQSNGGPVVFDVALSGRGNMRAAARPHFDGDVAGAIEIEEGRVVAARTSEGATSSRHWKFLIFPEKAGLLQIPPMSTSVFVPSLASTRVLRCGAQTLDAQTVVVHAPSAQSRAARSVERRQWLPWVVGGSLALIFLLIASPRAKRAIASR
ncbi:MAG TPA: BatD family protein, partial [Thermoanaerobaculia bacterium]|nr:BatD family protein [Thermoanaerobaculia bacterium]